MSITSKILLAFTLVTTLTMTAHADWTDVSLGTTGITKIDSLGSDGNILYAVANDNQLWSYNGVSWEKLHTKKYSYGNICVIGGKVYTNEGYYDISARTWNTLTLPASTGVTGERFRVDSCMRESIGMVYNTRSPVILVYTPANGIFLNTSFSATWLDGKPHIDLIQDRQGRLLYLSNYSGVYLYENGNWKKVREESGAVGQSADGVWYHSNEIAKTTQLAKIYRSRDWVNWESIADVKGYAYKCYPLETSSVYCIDGRFGAFRLEANGTTTNLGGYDTALGDRDLRVTSVQVMGSVIYQVKNRGSLPTLQQYQNSSVSSPVWVVTPPPLVVTPPTIITTPTPPPVISTPPVSPPWTPPANTVSMSPPAVLPTLASTIDLEYATYLTPGIASQAVWLQWDGTNIYIGVNSPTGVIKIYDPLSKTMIHEITFPEKILDFKVANGRIYTITTGNTYITGTRGDQLANSAGGKRVTIGKNWEYYVLDNKLTVTRYNSLGTSIGSRTLRRSYVEDILYHTESDRLLVVGFDNKKLPGGNPVQVAYLLAFDSGFELQYVRFGFEGINLSRNIADTRLYHLSTGADNKVYLLGESAGSQTIFRYNGVAYSGTEILSKIDIFTELWNTGSAHIAYFAKLDPSTGNIDNAALSMSRLLSTKWKGKSNTYRVRDGNITADSAGNIVIAGINTSTFGGRDNVRILGSSLDTYSGSDGTIQALSTDMKSRKFWITLGKSGGAKSEMRDVLIQNWKLYYLGGVLSGEVFTTDSSTRGGAETVQFGLMKWR